MLFCGKKRTVELFKFAGETQEEAASRKNHQTGSENSKAVA